MDTEQMLLWVALEQGIGEQYTDGLVEGEGIAGCCLQCGPQMSSTLGDNLFRDGVGMQKGTQAQEIGCGGGALLDLDKGEGPGGCYGFWMIGHESTACFEQFDPLAAVELEIIGEAALYFLDIGSSLV